MCANNSWFPVRLASLASLSIVQALDGVPVYRVTVASGGVFGDGDGVVFAYIFAEFLPP